MKPGVIDVDNLVEMFSDEYRRKVTAEARQYAEEGKPPRMDWAEGCVTYWDQIVAAHKALLWLDAYERRKARIERKRSAADRR